MRCPREPKRDLRKGKGERVQGTDNGYVRESEVTLRGREGEGGRGDAGEGKG